MIIRRTRLLIFWMLAMLVAMPIRATFCATPKTPPQPPPKTPNQPLCEPKPCKRCSTSPCYIAWGSYVDEYVDLQIPTTGTKPLVVSRSYDSSGPADGPLGAGWSSSLTAHLYYAAYLFSAPSSYSYEADVAMPDGPVYRFTKSGNTFNPPFGRHETLVQNGDGSYSLTPQFTRSVYQFSADGNLMSFTDDYGNVINYTYDGSGRLQRIADASGSGRYLDMTWGTDGRLASVADNAGRVLKYFYENGNGTLSSFSDPSVSSDSSQRTRYYSYVFGRFGPVLSRIEDRWHRVITDVDWYSSGEVKSYTEGQYDGSSASSGEKYIFTYSRGPSSGTVIKTDSLGSRTFAYNFAGLVDNYTTYDGSGQLTTETTPFGTTRTYTYDARGNVSTMTDAAANWTYTYDANFPDKVTSIKSNQPASWAGWTYEYNLPGTTAAGALARVFRIRTDGTTKDQVAAYGYDSHGHVTSFTDENAFTTTYGYNAAGDLTSVTRGGSTPATTSFGYDSLGRQTSVISPDGQTTSYTYDPLDRVMSVTLPKPTATSTLNFTTSYSYDNFDAATGLVFTNVTDPNSRVTKTGYDALGHVVRTIDALANVTRFTYQFNLLEKIADANGNETTYTYNANRELSGTTFPDGATETYSISRGVLNSKTDRKGHLTTYSYDGLGRILSDGIASYGYSGQNRTGAGGFLFTYDSRWRLSTETAPSGEKTTYTYIQTFAPYTAPSLLSGYQIEPPTGATWTAQTVSYGYDFFGRVIQMTWSWAPSQSFFFSYAPNGFYSQITFPNGQRRTFVYDNQGRLTNLTNKDTQGGTLASFDYAYDHDWTSNSDGMLGQRTSVSISAPGTNLENGLTKYRYDAAYQLTRTDHPDGSYEAWTYDAIGNRTSTRTRFGLIMNAAYYKNGSNPNNGQRLRNEGYGPWPLDFTYDANGNQTRDSQGSITGWDDANRMISYNSSSIAYDYLGRRRSVTVGSGTTRYIDLGMHTVGERNTTTGIATDYVFGPGIDEPLAKRTANGSISYYGVDGLGSVVLTTDSAGTVTNSTSYSAWGEPSQTPELFGYTGREYGWPWFYRARYYDPVRGRFLSQDPIRFRGGINLYAYALNRPTSYTDPSGTCVCMFKGSIGRLTIHPNCRGKLPIWIIDEHNAPAARAVAGTTVSADGFVYEGTLYKIDGSTCVEIDCSGSGITVDSCVNILACLLGKRAPYSVPPGQFGGPPKEPPSGTPPPIAQ